MTIAPTSVLEVRNLKKYFPVRRGFFGRQTGTVYAVDGISFSLRAGETLGLVGESGCGKSTAGKMILKLIEPTAGEIYLDGERIDRLGRGAMRRRRSALQVVFQDPYSSLNPRLRAKDIVAEPLRNFAPQVASEIDEGVAQLFELDPLDDTAVLHIETGNDADLEHQRRPCRASAAMLKSARAVTVSGVTPVVLHSASVSRSRSSASASRGESQLLSWSLNDAWRMK